MHVHLQANVQNINHNPVSQSHTKYVNNWLNLRQHSVKLRYIVFDPTHIQRLEKMKRKTTQINGRITDSQVDVDL